MRTIFLPSLKYLLVVRDRFYDDYLFRWKEGSSLKPHVFIIGYLMDAKHVIFSLLYRKVSSKMLF
jgi:hypothetical protein